MNITIDLKNYEDIISKYSETPYGDSLLSFVETFTYAVELLDENDRVSGSRALWRAHTQPIYEGAHSLDILIESSMLLVYVWEHGEMFLSETLTPFERSVIVENMIAMQKAIDERKSEEQQ